MRTLIRFLLFTAFLSVISLCAPQLYAQGVSSSGTEFWLGFMPNGTPGGGNFQQLNLFIASGTANKVTVTVQGSSRSINLAADDVYDMLIDQNAITSQSETPTDNAIHVVSRNPVTIYAYNIWTCPACSGGSPDGYLALPIEGLGTRYYTVNFPDGTTFSSGGSNGLRKGEFLIIAPYDNTDVTITPKAPTLGGHLADVPFSISLKRGQTYLVQSPGSFAGDNDLTGSQITSNRPVGVVTGHEISSVPVGLNSADHFAEMIAPVDRWGTQYFDMPMAYRTVCGDYIRVLSGEDGNQITYNGRGPFILNAGEYADRDLVNEPEVYTSITNQKFIVAQYSYSQGFNGDPGLADPFMILFTPQEQFETEMIFRTPTPSRANSYSNYLTFITEYDSIKKITINGKGIGAYEFVGLQKFLNTDPVMAGYRVKLPTLQRNYVARSPTPFGAYQYGFSFYEGYGWPTGQALRIVSPDTLPPLLKIVDSSCGTYHLRFFEPRLKPTTSFDDTRISRISLITDLNDARWPKPSVNYTWIPDPNFLIGDSATGGTLQLTDPATEGYAALYAVDRAGNDTVYEFHYYPPQITFTPLPSYDFGEVILDHDSCRTITVANIQAAGDFLADSSIVIGTATGGTFTATPQHWSAIHAGESAPLTICYHPTDTGLASIDTVYLISHCVPYPMVVTGVGITPLIYAPDLDFGSVDSGKTLCKPLVIRNPGEAPLRITSQDLVSDPDFSIDPATQFPIVIPPHGSATVQFCFHPQHWGTFSKLVTYFNQNPDRFKHSIKDTSLLTGRALPAGALLTSYEKTFGISCKDTILFDTLYNNLKSDKEIDSIAIVGTDASFFQFTGLSVTYPFNLEHDSLNNIPIQIHFAPTTKGLDITPRTAIIQVYAHDGGPAPFLTVHAQLVTPIVTLSAPSLDLGKGRIGGTVNGTFTITNTGNAPLNVTSYGLTGADASAFTLSPAPPFTVGAGAKQIVTVSATGTDPRVYNATVTIDGGCQTASITQKATFSRAGDDLLGTDHGKVYTGGCRSNVVDASYVSTFTDPVTITDWSIEAVNGWNNASDFHIDVALPTAGITIQPGTEPVPIPIKFTPTDVGPRAAGLVVSLKGKGYLGTDSTWTQTREVQGIGNALTRTIAVGSVTTAPVYHQTPSNSVDVPVVINQSIETGAPDNGTAEAYGYQFNISWKRDAFRYGGAINPPSATVGAPTYDAATDMETRTVKYTSQVAISGMPTLATLTVESMLTKADSSQITVSDPIWLGNDGQPLCYVTNSVQTGSYVLDPVCGSSSLKGFLTSGNISVDEIHPNPTRNVATIDCQLARAGAITVSVFDMMGNEVDRMSYGFNAGMHEIPVGATSMKSGSYYCRISDGRSVITRRFEIAK